jgi:hypothetical protein
MDWYVLFPLSLMVILAIVDYKIPRSEKEERDWLASITPRVPFRGSRS